ncbi:MAG: transposase [Methanophagales archaeon]|nr:transposase [Methanophagales archaeon]
MKFIFSVLLFGFLFIKYPPKYSVSGIAKRIKGRSSKLLRDNFQQLKEWCPGIYGHLLAIMVRWGKDGKWWRGIYRGRRVTRRQILYRWL